MFSWFVGKNNKHDKNNDTKCYAKLAKYLLNGFLFDSITKSCI